MVGSKDTEQFRGERMAETLICKKCEREAWHCGCKSPDFSESPGTAGSIAKISDEAMALANELAQKWWSGQKISYQWDNVLDVAELAYVIDNKRML